MSGTENPAHRESIPFWRDDETVQNFGDFLTLYLLDRLFIRVPRRPGDVRLVGSYLHDYHVGQAAKRPAAEGLSQGAALIAWAGGAREPGGLSEASRRKVEVLSVRGPLTARELKLGDHIAIGDPALLLPALHDPRPDPAFSGKTVCAPHFDDTRSDDEIRALTQADLVLRPGIGRSLAEIETFIDRLASADFVLCGSLHAAIVAAAYGRPFAFWDSGRIDIPFKWRDFAASVGIDCAFLPDVPSGRAFHDQSIRPHLRIPSMWQALAVAPYPLRPDALLRILVHEQAKGGTAADLGAIAQIFARHRDRSQEIADDSARLIEDLFRTLRDAETRATALARSLTEAAEAQARNSAEAAEALARSSAEAAQAAAILIAEGDRLAEELRRAYARPWRPLKRALQRLVLRLILLFRGRLSERRVRKLLRSVEKRRSRVPVDIWRQAVSRAMGEAAPAARPTRARKVRRTGGSIVAYGALMGLAALSAPLSKRRSSRFRRSAEKRSPWQVQDGGAGAEDIVERRRGPAADPARARRILVADYRLPRPDVSAGEKATFGLVADLCALGFEVTFVPTDMKDIAPYRQDLETLGVTVITDASGHRYGGDYIRAEGARFGAFYFIRVDVAEALLPSARAVAPDAPMIFHAPDLYFLREERAARLSGQPAALADAARTRAREAAIMKACDHVVLVSPAEIPHLAEIVPHEKISVFPALYSPVVGSPAGYGPRRDIFFLGGFKHTPNVDAVKWFVDAVWPQVHAALPEAEFHIIGAEAPEDVIALGTCPGVRFIGYVADLDPVLASHRLSVAPLLYGAGIKGKLGAAMGAGVPSVSTTIGAEGMGIVDGVHALVRDEPRAFAEAVITLYRDPDLWERIARNGRRLVEDRFGDLANQSAFFRVLDEARVLPLDLYVEHCRTAAPAPLPDPAPSEEVEVSVILPVYNQWSMTRACLNSVLRAVRGSGITCEIILADDGSTDETIDAARIFPGLRVVRQAANLGFLRNCNAAAAEARGKALLFLNNDTVVLPGWLTGLVQVLHEEPSAAIVGSKLLYPDGTIQEAGGVLFDDADAANLGRGMPRHEPLFSVNREVDYVTGAALLIRRSVWEAAGGFDTRFAPAYCEDSDLAMTARAQGFTVVCAAQSQVVHFEHGSYGEQMSSTPKRRAAANGQRLREKWSSVLARDHLPRSTAPAIAAAHAERHPFAAARARRGTGRLNILYFSPFPSHPDNHGNQATIQSFARRFQKMGHRVHFALLQSRMYDDAAFRAMQSAWDSLDILPNTHPLGADGKPIPFDGWYEAGLGENIRLLCEKYDIDVVFCSYVFQSKLLEFVPAHVLKVIDTHDKMGNRYEMLRANGQPIEFFSCSPEEEGAYLRRADLVAARRAEEAEYFNAVTGRASAIVLPHVEDERALDRPFGPLRKIGVVASANRINLIILHDFLAEIARRCGDDCPFTVEVAGQVRSMVSDLTPGQQRVFQSPWVRMLGFVPDIASFYREIDLVVSPVTMGTGINVKTVQAMAFGMPLLTTRVGIKGIETDEPLHHHETLHDLVASLLDLAGKPEELPRLAAISTRRYRSFLAAADGAIQAMFDHPKIQASRTGAGPAAQGPGTPA